MEREGRAINAHRYLIRLMLLRLRDRQLLRGLSQKT